jgi:hypothetical protein
MRLTDIPYYFPLLIIVNNISPPAKYEHVRPVTHIDVSETAGLADVLLQAEEDGSKQVSCMYTGVTNLYRCYKR